MALSNEDHKDVKKHFGKALAKKISKATNDKEMAKATWKSEAPFKSAMEAISHPAFNKMHSSLRRQTKLKREAKRGPVDQRGPAPASSMRRMMLEN